MMDLSPFYALALVPCWWKSMSLFYMISLAYYRGKKLNKYEQIWHYIAICKEHTKNGYRWLNKKLLRKTYKHKYYNHDLSCLHEVKTPKGQYPCYTSPGPTAPNCQLYDIPGTQMTIVLIIKDANERTNGFWYVCIYIYIEIPSYLFHLRQHAAQKPSQLQASAIPGSTWNPSTVKKVRETLL